MDMKEKTTTTRGWMIKIELEIITEVKTPEAAIRTVGW